MPSFSDEAYLRALRGVEGLRIEVRGGDIISFSRGGEPAANILYIASLHAGMDVRLASAVELSYHLLPYAERSRAIIFSPRRDLRAVSAAIAASILGAEVIFVAPPQGANVEERLEMRGVERVTLPEQSPMISSSFLAAMSAPKLMGFRESRVRGELAALSEALTWLRAGAERLRGASFEAVLYTPVTKAGAYYLRHASGCSEPAPLEALPELRASRALAMYSSLEESEYRDVLSSLPPWVEPLRVDADPVTASLYSVILSAIISDRLI